MTGVIGDMSDGARLALEDDGLINVGQIRPTARVNAYLLYTVNAPPWKGSNKIIAEAFKLSRKMPSELLPFWTKYWCYVLIGVITYASLKLFRRLSRRSGVFIENDKNSKFLNDTAEQLEGNNSFNLRSRQIHFL